MRQWLVAVLLIGILVAILLACEPARCPKPGYGACSDLLKDLL